MTAVYIHVRVMLGRLEDGYEDGSDGEEAEKVVEGAKSCDVRGVGLYSILLYWWAEWSYLLTVTSYA